MTPPLTNRVALVTGASRGIGKAIALRLAKLGAGVAICARNEREIEAAAQQVRAAGRKVFAAAADIRQPGEIRRFAKKTEDELGPIEIVVNNAGIGVFGAFQQASEADWDAVLETNLKAVFVLSQAVAPGMIERRSGHIINLASLAGKNAFAGGAIYCASKWGLLGLTYCMAEDLRQYGIRVSAICPGSVLTEFSHPSSKDPKKMLQPEDVAHAVEMLVTQAPQSFISEVLLRPAQKP